MLRANAWSSVTSIPPPLVVITLLPLKDSAATPVEGTCGPARMRGAH